MSFFLPNSYISCRFYLYPINSKYATNDNIELNHCDNGYRIKIKSTTYGVYKNGNKIQDGEIIENMDFLSVGDVSFYIKDNSLWTDISDKCIVNNSITIDYKNKNLAHESHGKTGT